uniref:coiled-coil domain-containing protein 12-like n=1 Tax=Oncorhynchus gorbuscha TaxID=8017 RepID=UPI001EAF3CBD|nr:coiled-coil domain-containing protein 12-like [Oncorhynchus gorbuscha]
MTTGERWRGDGEPDRKRDRAEEEAEEERHRELKLRNYTPEDEELKERQVPKAKPVSVEEKVKEQLDAGKPESVIEEVDLANLAPRKPDWDLKRDVAKKLEKLERRTQKAIAELIRQFVIVLNTVDVMLGPDMTGLNVELVTVSDYMTGLTVSDYDCLTV